MVQTALAPPKNWISRLTRCLPEDLHDRPAWTLTSDAEAIITRMIDALSANDCDDYEINGGWAIHRSATVEGGATLKPPVIIGPNVLVASNAYLRGGVFIDQGGIIGPGCEVKSTFMFEGSKIAHLSFVGDTLIGSRANIEAGAMVANYRNERDNKRILIRYNTKIIDTGIDKFGALIGDNVRIGANAVIAPGALLAPESVVARLTLIDQSAI